MRKINKRIMNLEQKAEKLIKEYNMIDSSGNILVAFSGGSDSSALLFFLINYIKNTGEDKKDKIYAAHMNHTIRGEESDNDEKFAVDTCEKYNIKLFTEHKNIPEIVKTSKKSVEEAARDERYDFFCRVAESIGGDIKVATAHTASDNSETVIFNLARGCGLTGFSGISPVNIIKNKNIIRPFLSCSKEDILEYCKRNNILYIEDKTNTDENYTRNFIRHNITSRLKEKFNNLDENIFKTTEITRDAADFLNSCADDLIKNNSDKSNEIDIYALLTSHKALQRAVITRLYENAVCPDTKKLEFKHVLYVEELLKNSGNSKKSIDLPGFVTAVISENRLIFEKTENKKTSRNRKII
ncbi:MAG: tRNA lysidine(34) synthetase TilS [Oscillospiraceae bacterium]|nr:tRNA lysidine(34) synthetase TilS [Oscillospiraceae bacterium]